MATPQAIQDFVALTHTDEEFARSFLEASGGDFQAAVELFLGGNGGFAAPPGFVPQPPPALPDDFAAFATSDDGVRAPISPKRARLFDLGLPANATADGFERGGYDPMHAGAMQMAMNIMGTIPAPNADAPMFPVPKRLVFFGSFDDARASAKQRKKWLLVNLQDYQEFHSIVLNRDLWSNDMIGDFILDNFVFWQRSVETPDGQRFLNLYKVQRPFPFVGIIDPRTGGLMQNLRLKDQDDSLRLVFIEQVTAFVEKHSLADFKATPTFRAAAAAQSSSSAAMGASAPASSSFMPPLSMPPSTMAAEEDDPELMAAIRASLESYGVAGSGDMMEDVELVSSATTKPSGSRSAGAGGAAGAAGAGAAAAAASQSQSLPLQPSQLTPPPPQVKQQLPELNPEPGAQTRSGRIRFRLPNNQTVNRTFALSDPVSQVYAFVAHTLQHTGFDLLFSAPPQTGSLRGRFDDSIEAAGLVNSTVNVRLS